MITCLIKTSTHAKAGDRAYTMVELTISVAISVLLFTGVYGFFTTTSQVYSNGISGQNLQDGASVVLSKIIEGENESGTIYRLSTAQSFVIPDGTTYLYTCGGTPQTTPCNSSNIYGEVYFCQDNPCTPGDATARWYYLDSSGMYVKYHHPATGGGTVEETIYKAPLKTTLTLRFSYPLVGSPAATTTKVLGIDVAILPTLSGTITNNRLKISGAASTYVLLRNH